MIANEDRTSALVLIATALLLAQERGERHPERFALLVGVGEYPAGSQLDRLAGCARDVERMREVLVERCGFPPQGIATLIDGAATHERIVRVFRDVLIANAAPGVELVFFFSGHGSRARDESGERRAEPDGLDSTLVAHDSRGPDGNAARDISDDELRSLAAAALARGARLLVVTDACHSGGVLRSAGERTAKAARDLGGPVDLAWVRSFWPEDVPLTDDGEAPLSSEGYLHIAACARDQRAYEIELRVDGELEKAGALTYFLARSLDGAREGDAWRTVVEQCKARVARFFPEQVPSAEGELDRPVFDGAVRTAVGFAARARPGSVLVEAGRLHGLRAGDELEILDAGGQRSYGRARVDALDELRARAVWVQAPTALPEGGLRAVERRLSSGRALRVKVGDERLAQILGPLAVSAGESAEYRLGEADGRLVLETIEGHVLARLDPEDALRTALEGELSWRRLFDLGASRGPRPLEVSVRAATPAELAGSPGHAPLVLTEAHDGSREARGAAPGGTPLPVGVLEIRNPHAHDAFVSVLSVGEDRSSALLEFSSGERNVLLPQDEGARVYFGIRASSDWELARPMRDRFLVIATSERADFGALVRSASLRSSEPRDLAGLPEELRAALSTGELRGERLGATVPRWGVTALDLLVVCP